MSNLSVSRLFKATRRTIVAEVTLMIVIVISFSWSAYALYKLFAGGSETLFGYTFANTLQPTQVDRVQEPTNNSSVLGLNSPSFAHLPSNQNHHQIRNLDRIPAATIQNDQDDLEEQLANYKSKILNELLARQRKLLGDAKHGGHDILSLLSSGRLNRRTSDEQIDYSQRPTRIRELQQWRGGYNMPKSLDYLFENGKSRRSVITGHQREHTTPLSSSKSYPSVAVKQQPHTIQQQSLIHLTNAPSLMQLRPTALSEQNHQQVATTPRPRKETSNDESFQANDSSDNDADNDQIITTTTTTTTPSPSHGEGETTTTEPTAHLDEREDAQDDSAASNEDSDGDENDQPEVSADDDDKNESDSSNKVANEPMEGIRKTSKSIDEDVDRMTQPSLGVASQQDKPLSPDYKNTVQFDDGPARPSSVRDILVDKSRKPPTDMATVLQKSGNRRSNENTQSQNLSGDLLVADDQNSLPTSAMTKNDPKTTHQSPPRNADFKAGNKMDNSKFARSSHLLGGEHKPSDTKDGRVILNRSKRSNEFFNETNTNQPEKPEKSHGAKSHSTSLRRSDDDDDDEGESEGENADEAQDNQEETQDSEAGALKNPSPTLQELLAHKQLLDALQQSQIPSPVAGTHSVNRSVPYEITHPPGADQGDDHQSSGTQYSVDHGLLLYPASDEEHEHKSMSHKSGKKSEKKGKKKVTLAVKKGGHKKKKHKKEEKKYIKEKKFKGAKKGKKMSKGKGGKGGKKGKKFYKDKGFKKKGFKNIYVKNEFGQKKSYFDEFRDKDFKKKWKNFDDKYNYAQMKKWQAKDVKGAKKMKDHGEHHKKYDKGKWKKDYQKHMESESAKKKKKKSYDF